MILMVEQILNGLQFGRLLFLLAAGLTLALGIMDSRAARLISERVFL
jgi:branched-chain amino acid transport system permease protein